MRERVRGWGLRERVRERVTSYSRPSPGQGTHTNPVGLRGGYCRSVPCPSIHSYSVPKFCWTPLSSVLSMRWIIALDGRILTLQKSWKNMQIRRSQGRWRFARAGDVGFSPDSVTFSCKSIPARRLLCKL